MASNINLLRELLPHGVDPSELALILSDHYHLATMTGPNTVVYPGAATDCALRLDYHPKTQSLIRITPGPAYDEAVLGILKQRMTDELISSPGPKVLTTFLFSHSVPVQGAWRYRDMQILPPPAGAPLPTFMMADFPFLLQVSHRSSSNFLVGNLRFQRQAMNISLLLNCLLSPGVHATPRYSRHEWVIELPDSKDLSTMRTLYGQIGYMVHNFGVPAEGFAPIDKIPALTSLEHNAYYSQRGVVGGSVMTIPATLEQSLDKFFKLSTLNQQRFIRACYWFNHAHMVFQSSQSASFMALINAVETLLPELRGEPHCSECGKPKHSVVSRFKEFMECYTYDSSREAKEARQRLYDIRSVLSHGTYLLHADIEYSWGLSPQKEQERQYQGTAWGWTRIAMVNWLSSQ